MSGYCPAGKCECERFMRLIDENPDRYPYCNNGQRSRLINDFDACPWPSCQVMVDVPDTENPNINIFEQGKAAGRLAGIGECVGEIKKMLFPLDLNDESDFWRSSVLNEAIAALENMRGK